MPITYTWAEVDPVYSEQYITAEENNKQNDILQSRDMFLSRKFDDYYKKVEIDNLLNSYTTNLDWKESVETFNDILVLHPTDISTYNWLSDSIGTYKELLQLYPNDYDEIIWQNPVDTYDTISRLYPSNYDYLIWQSPVETFETIESAYPEPDNNWAVEVISTGDKYRYDGDTDKWYKVISAPENNWGVEVTDTNTKYRYNDTNNEWNRVIDKPVDKDGIILEDGTKYVFSADTRLDELVWKDPVENFENIALTYDTPEENWAVEVQSTGDKYKYNSETGTWDKIGYLWNLLDAPPQDGWTINVKDTNYTYRYDGPTNTWIPISANAIPLASEELDGLMSKTDYILIRSLGLEAQFKEEHLIDEEGNIADLEGILAANIIPKIFLAMSQMEEKMLPLGTVVPFLLNTSVPPAGFIFAEGQELSRTGEYEDLWLKVSQTNDTEGNPLVISDSDRYDYPGKFTDGDGYTTFRVPDLRGYFLRAFDDSGREFGSRQGDSVAEHNHRLKVTGVGSINEAVASEEGQLTLAGTTSNQYDESETLIQYTSNNIETRPKNIAIRYLIKAIPTEKLPVSAQVGHIPEIHDVIDADTLNGHPSSLTAHPGTIPVANAQGKLDASWFSLDNYHDLIWKEPVENLEDLEIAYPSPENNWAVEVISTGDKYKYNSDTESWEKIDYLFDDIFVNDAEVSYIPDSRKIPKTTSSGNLDEWISRVTEEDVDRWIRFLSSPEEDEATILDLSSFNDDQDTSKFFVTKKKFQKFLTGLKLVIATYDHHYTTEDIEPTDTRNYISNAEKNSYANKYTKEETVAKIQNFLASYVPLVDTSTVPTPNKIPIADETGKLDSGWMSDLFLNKIGVDDTSGYAEVLNRNITIKSGIIDTSETGKVTIQGGGTYSLSAISPAKAVISGYDTVDSHGGNVEIYAASGGTDLSAIGGSVIIQSGTGSAYNGTIDLNNIKINKFNTIYTDELNLRLQQNDGLNNTNSLEINNNGLTYFHDNLINNEDDYTFTLNNDGSVTTNKKNVANSITVLNNKALVPFENLPKTSLINNIGEFSQNQSINTSLGNVIVGTLGQNSTLTISDDTESSEAKELTFVLTSSGPYNLNWPINITWTSGREPTISYNETAIIKLFRVGNREWIGWKVGDGTSGGSTSSILVDDVEIPAPTFTGALHIYVTDTESVASLATESVSLDLDVDDNIIVGNPVTVTATILPSDASGTCTFSVNTSPNISTINSVIEDGVAIAEFTDIPVGSYTVSCVYNGDSTYLTANVMTTFNVVEE